MRHPYAAVHGAAGGSAVGRLCWRQHSRTDAAAVRDGDGAASHAAAVARRTGASAPHALGLVMLLQSMQRYLSVPIFSKYSVSN